MHAHSFFYMMYAQLWSLHIYHDQLVYNILTYK